MRRVALFASQHGVRSATVPRTNLAEKRVYRRAYYQADAMLRERHRDEWRELLQRALVQQANESPADRRRGGRGGGYSDFEGAMDIAVLISERDDALAEVKRLRGLLEVAS